MNKMPGIVYSCSTFFIYRAHMIVCDYQVSESRKNGNL